MRLRTIIGVGALMTISVPAMAALPPYYQRIKEITAIIEHGGVNTALNEEPIDAVTYMSEDVYHVRGGKCRVVVRLNDIPRNMPGPRAFSIHVGKPICTKAK